MKVSPARCWTVTVVLFAVGLVALRAPAKAAPPNIVFILADDLGFMDIGANNPKTFYETPNIDALAQQGMRFTQGYAACSVCSPTRASIMTGKYPCAPVSLIFSAVIAAAKCCPHRMLTIWRLKKSRLPNGCVMRVTQTSLRASGISATVPFLPMRKLSAHLHPAQEILLIGRMASRSWPAARAARLLPRCCWDCY